VVPQLITATPPRSAGGRAAEPVYVAIIAARVRVYGGTTAARSCTCLTRSGACVVVLHTVLTDPTPHQRQVLELVIAKADAVVTMTKAARPARGRYAADMSKVRIIAHGAPAWRARWPSGLRTGEFTVLTWACSARQGIEWASRRWRCCGSGPMPR